MRGTNILSSLTKFWRDTAAGKIYRSPLGWIYSDTGLTNASGVFIPPREEKATGRLISLERRPAVRNCPTPPGDPKDFVQVTGINKTRYFVGERFCKKCPHRIRGGYCQELRRLAREGPPAEQKMAMMIDEAMAMQKTNAIMKGVL